MLKYGNVFKQIKDWNSLDRDYTIQIGQKLRVK
ncbi:LysM domain-containing protein [Vibrio vulnificus]|nr:LysM domain-containing protein [Vibrio vulnificus]